MGQEFRQILGDAFLLVRVNAGSAVLAADPLTAPAEDAIKSRFRYVNHRQAGSHEPVDSGTGYIYNQPG